MPADSTLPRAARAALVANAAVCASSLLGALALTRGVPVPPIDLPLWITALGLLNVVTAFAAALLDALAVSGARRTLPLLALSMSIALAMELSGTALGVPFGRYEYTQYLGWKLFGLVPVVMPLTWFSVVHPSMALAARLPWRRSARVVATAIVLVLADVPMDPAMTAGSACWRWHEAGPWYGMPLSNWVGWALVGLVVGSLFTSDRARPDRPIKGDVAVGLYALQGTFMALLASVYGRPGAGLAWLVGGAAMTLTLLRARRQAQPLGAPLAEPMASAPPRSLPLPGQRAAG